MKQLLALGPAAGKAAVIRLPNAPWFLQRNILVLLGRLGVWPDGFSPESYAADADPRIRREAIKLMLDSVAHRDTAITQGLNDADDGIVGLALSAALDSCPPEAMSHLERIAADPKRPSEARVLAIRTMARSGTLSALHLLRDLALPPRRWLRRRLAPKSAELLAALSGLAVHWPEDAVAAPALMLAMQHSDPEIRAAAGNP
jgi:phytoene dehydrogenase-like protein